MKIRIKLVGCDDTTIFEMELTEKEYELLQRVANLSEETSTYGCMPIMEVHIVKED